MAEAEQKLSEYQNIYLFKLAPANPRDMLKAELLAKVARQPQVRKWEKKLLIRKGKVTLLKARKEGLTYYVQAISREISRRSDEAKGGGRIT